MFSFYNLHTKTHVIKYAGFKPMPHTQQHNAKLTITTKTGDWKAYKDTLGQQHCKAVRNEGVYNR